MAARRAPPRDALSAAILSGLLRFPDQIHRHAEALGQAEQMMRSNLLPVLLCVAFSAVLPLMTSGKVAGAQRRPVLVGFAAETEKVLEHAREKLEQKGLDFVVANDVSEPGAGFGSDTNHVTILTRSGKSKELSGSKREVAAGIWDELARYSVSPS